MDSVEVEHDECGMSVLMGVRVPHQALHKEELEEKIKRTYVRVGLVNRVEQPDI